MTHLLMDRAKPNRVAGAVGFNVRTGNFYVFRAKAVIVAAGGASHIFKPRAVGEGMGRTWYAPWSSASAYALPILVGAKMTQMENRIVLTRFKDGYGPVGAYFLHLKTYTQNAYGEEYEVEVVRRHQAHWSATTLTATRCRPACATTPCSREVEAGRGPIRMVTKEAFQDPHKETIGWENFLGMTIGQAVVWASQNIDPKHTNPELTTSEPYVMGSHATCSGAWASGPEDYAPAGVPVGLQPHDDRRGPVRRRRHHRRHRPQVLVGLVHRRPHRRQGSGQIRDDEKGREQPQVSEAEIEDLKKTVYKPLENYRDRSQRDRRRARFRRATSCRIHGLQRLEKIMDEYVGGISVNYMTNEPLLTRGLELLGMLKEDRRQSWRRRPSPASARLGAAAPALGLGMRHPAHPVPQGNAVAGLLLPRRLIRSWTTRIGIASPCPATTGSPGSGRWRRRQCITSSTDHPAA